MQAINMKISILLKSCFFIQYLIWTANSQSDPRIIYTSSGPIQGSLLSVHGRRVYQYLRIPFAQPPLGDLRFKKPQPVQPWLETLNANRMPAGCIQYTEYPFPWFDFGEKSEDCLYLNVWVPEAKDENCNKKKKSVMFWIHGGSYSYGSSAVPAYNGRALAAKGDVIVVTTNYRLAAFGFFTTNTGTAPPNVAMYDILEALKWVNKNIGEFGGDPNQVTVFGESVGSFTAGYFCVSPLTKGLFNRVIMESGSPAAIMLDVPTNVSVALSQKLAQALGCADPRINIYTFPDKVTDCMRKKDPFEIAKTLNSFEPHLGIIYIPAYGDEFLPYSTREALKLGKFHDVSVLSGNNRDEGSIILTSFFSEVFGYFGEHLPKLNTSTVENMVKIIAKVMLKDVPGRDFLTKTVLSRLSKDDYRKNLKIIRDFFADFLLVCPTVYFAESYSRYGKDAHFYFFEHRPSITPWAKWMGVVHYDEVPFVFGSPLKENGYAGEEVELSKSMIEIWTDFAKYGELEQSNPSRANFLPSDQVLEKWPRYSQEMPWYLILDTTAINNRRYALGPHRENCDLLRPIHGMP